MKIKYKMIICISVFIFSFSLFSIYNWYNEKKEINKINLNIKKVSKEKEILSEKLINPPIDLTDSYYNYINKNLLNIDIKELKKNNNDIIGFLKVGGTLIDSAVVQTIDNEFYLNHSIDKKENKAGAIFADFRNDFINFDKNNIIYGHGRLDKIMFGSLKNVLNNSWYQNKDNHLIYLSTENDNTLWQIISVYKVEKEKYYIKTHFRNKDEYYNFLKVISDRSIYDFHTSLNTKDKILTLSTCSGDGNKRIVVHAKLIKKETIN